MTDASKGFALHVVAGPDLNARLLVDDRVRTVGRARDADLSLQDVTVSRHHLQVVATAEGLHVSLCAGAAPFVVAGSAREAIDAKLGDSIVIGNTVLLVAASDPTPRASSEPHRSEVRTLLTGMAVDVRGLAAVHALVTALDAVNDASTAESAIKAWATAHADALDIELVREKEDAEPAASAAQVTVVEKDDSKTPLTFIAVPAPGDHSARLVLKCAIPASRITDSYRRMLVVAGRICGSALGRLHRLQVAETEREALRTLSFGSARAFLGTSPAAEKLARLIPRLAASDVSVLLQGETGTGKSFVARLIHEAGPRAGEPLRVINCAAIPESLIESELFGHERGAFTGAMAQRIGAFESAGRGSLFLDEIGELPLASQAKLLRVLEERRFERIGSNKPVDLHARVLCATNRDLQAMVARGEFRSDLFFRIAVVRAVVPPVRERGDDLLLLARHILGDCAQSAGRRIEGFSREATEAIRRYSWPGNVRELRNAIEHAIVLGDGRVIEASDLPSALTSGADREVPGDPSVVRLPASLEWLERKAIEAALRETGGNRTRAAALLGINRQTLYNKLAEAPSQGRRD